MALTDLTERSARHAGWALGVLGCEAGKEIRQQSKPFDQLLDTESFIPDTDHTALLTGRADTCALRPDPTSG